MPKPMQKSLKATAQFVHYKRLNRWKLELDNDQVFSGFDIE